MPTFISRTSLLSILDVLGGSFHFSKFLLIILYASSGCSDQTTQYAVSDLGLHCLHMSHKKEAGLILVKL